MWSSLVRRWLTCAEESVVPPTGHQVNLLWFKSWNQTQEMLTNKQKKLHKFQDFVFSSSLRA